ncbi:glycogen branching enzyme, partial [Pasteurella multocida subsp. multocida str. Anand1_cattle]
DSAFYQGSNVGNYGEVGSEAIPSHARAQSICVSIPPLATYLFEISKGNNGA